MKPIIYFLSLFYRWYNSRKSTKDIAYESAIIALELFFFINALSLLKLLAGISFEFWYMSKLNLYPIIILAIIVTGIIISLLAPKKKIVSINYELRDSGTDYSVLIIYIISSFILLIISAKS